MISMQTFRLSLVGVHLPTIYVFAKLVIGNVGRDLPATFSEDRNNSTYIQEIQSDH